jgi:hypothetical protein
MLRSMQREIEKPLHDRRESKSANARTQTINQSSGKSLKEVRRRDNGRFQDPTETPTDPLPRPYRDLFAPPLYIPPEPGRLGRLEGLPRPSLATSTFSILRD